MEQARKYASFLMNMALIGDLTDWHTEDPEGCAEGMDKDLRWRLWCMGVCCPSVCARPFS